MPDVLADSLSDTIDSIKQFLHIQRKDIVTVLRQPTPIKITRVATADASGNIGGGITLGTPVMLYQISEAHEAWINRVTVSSPGHGPSSPLTAGEAWVQTNTGFPLFFLPVGGNVAPVIITEGRLSAPHLSPGEQIMVSGDGLGAGTVLKFDFQIVLVSGVSADTPLQHISNQQPALVG